MADIQVPGARVCPGAAWTRAYPEPGCKRGVGDIWGPVPGQILEPGIRGTQGKPRSQVYPGLTRAVRGFGYIRDPGLCANGGFTGPGLTWDPGIPGVQVHQGPGW